MTTSWKKWILPTQETILLKDRIRQLKTKPPSLLLEGKNIAGMRRKFSGTYRNASNWGGHVQNQRGKRWWINVSGRGTLAEPIRISCDHETYGERRHHAHAMTKETRKHSHHHKTFWAFSSHSKTWKLPSDLGMIISSWSLHRQVSQAQKAEQQAWTKTLPPRRFKTSTPHMYHPVDSWNPL